MSLSMRRGVPLDQLVMAGPGNGSVAMSTPASKELRGTVDDRYEAFCAASPLFYDVLHSAASAGPSFCTADRVLAGGWRRLEQDDWFAFRPDGVTLPEQGWKIHVAACLDNAERILDAVWDFCVSRGIEFKFLRSPATSRRGSPSTPPRGYSGKLVTIYLVDDRACETILRELGDLLAGEASPYILSDLRWGEGPLYVRYGSFVNRYCVSPSG
jgi:class III lanthionine synthetase